MEETSIDQILVITAIESTAQERRPERGLGEKLTNKAVSAVAVTVLKKNVECFFGQLKEILDTGSDRIGAFEVTQVEICAEITGDGHVCLMGSGVKMEVQGGIRFILKRVPE